MACSISIVWGQQAASILPETQCPEKVAPEELCSRLCLVVVDMNPRAPQLSNSTPSALRQCCAHRLGMMAECVQFIWGGRNSTDYFEDGWVFHVANRSWTELAADPTVHQPRARDHLGAFYYQGSVWIYGVALL